MGGVGYRRDGEGASGPLNIRLHGCFLSGGTFFVNDGHAEVLKSGVMNKGVCMLRKAFRYVREPV